MRNLLYAISVSGDTQIQPYVFFGTQVDEQIVNSFRPLATVVTTKLLDRKSVPWFVNKVLIKLFGSFVLVKRELSRHGISIVSHAANVYGRRAPLRVISWIPDFQYLHFPELFPGLDSEAETRYLQKIITETDVVVLSSYAAYQDFLRIAPEGYAARGRVLQFVSQPNSKLISENTQMSLNRVEEKYDFKGDFFFLPNQFWVHKNHAVVFEAVRLLKARGGDVLVLCTGNLYDYRTDNTSHADSLNEFIQVNKLQQNIKILGLIDYDDVLCLMKNCLAVLNPSRFEGWSSTVEEAKSIGKQIVLSNIPVHIEQAPLDGRYFSPDDAKGLAVILGELWIDRENASNQARELLASARLRERTVAFGRSYVELVHKLENS
jgi:glycosyltransferase involved in cell wall biosynthesis